MNRRNRKTGIAEKFKVIVLPTQYPCCADGTCPQHQQQGEIEYEFLLHQASYYRTTVPKYTDTWLLESLSGSSA